MNSPGSQTISNAPNGLNSQAIQLETFNSFPVNQAKKFDIFLASHINKNDLSVSVANPILGPIDAYQEWIPSNRSNNICRVTFRAPIVGIYSISVDLANRPQHKTCFQAKAYDLAKVIISSSSRKCYVNESFEFSVDASEAGEGQLEIAVNEGEIPNQVQVLDNGKCIVNFVPEEAVPHVVDIKFNSYNVHGCPFIVEVEKPDIHRSTQSLSKPPSLYREERVLVNSTASFSLEDFDTNLVGEKDLRIVSPENQAIDFHLKKDSKQSRCSFEFVPSTVGDYTVELNPKSVLCQKLPNHILEQLPFSLKVFDFNKVIVSEVTDGVIGHPIYFFIDASQAGSGNLEIKVSSKTRTVPNRPQSESNAKIRVNFTPTEAVDHLIDVNFNGYPVPCNPFLVKVAQFPQARLPVTSQDVLKYVAINEEVSFYVDYLANKDNKVAHLDRGNCRVKVLSPEFIYTELDRIEIQPSEKNEKQSRFKINFKPTRIGPYKIFVIVNNELLPATPIISNVYDIDEVKVSFESLGKTSDERVKAVGTINKPITFTVDASRAGEGTLALAVISNISQSLVQTDVKVSEKGHGLYGLTFVPIELAPHSIDMSFNDRVVPGSPFIVKIYDDVGRPSIEANKLSAQSGSSKQDETLDGFKKTEVHKIIQDFESLRLDNGDSITKSKSAHKLRKNLAQGLMNSTNIVFIDAGIIDNPKTQIDLLGPKNEKILFTLTKTSPYNGEPKKSCIEYRPQSIGTYTLNVLDSGNELRQYFIEICDPDLIRLSDFNRDGTFTVGRPITFCIDTRESGNALLESITIFGPKKIGKTRDGEQTILGKIKSISSPSHNQNPIVKYSVTKLNDYKQEVKFVPQTAGKYSIDIRCLGQPVAKTPIEVNVENFNNPQENNNSRSTYNTMGKTKPHQQINREDELLQSIVVHGISLKCSPVNSTGAFIIETNRSAQARDFDVLITDPSNNLVDVQCYLQQDGNLLAEWTPKRVGTHKIEVLFKDRQVPGSPFITEAFDPSSVIIKDIKTTICSVNDTIQFKLDRKHAGYGELDVAITSPVGQDLPINVEPIEEDNEVGEVISFTPTVTGKYKLSITFGGYEVPKSPITFTAMSNQESMKVSGTGIKCAEVNRTAQFVVESSSEGELKLRIESGDREIVPKVEKHNKVYTIKYKPTEVGVATISLYWNGSHIEDSPFTVPVNDLSKILFLSGTNKSSTNNNQRMIDFEPGIAREITLDTSKCGPGKLKAEAYCRAYPSMRFSLPVEEYATNRYLVKFAFPPRVDQLTKDTNLKDLSAEATYLIRFHYNNILVPETLASVILSPYKAANDERHIENNNNVAKPSDMIEKKIKATPHTTSNNHTDCPIVALRGHGLIEAQSGEKAEFTIDGTEAGMGKPEVRLSNVNENVDVQLEKIGDKIYKASYIAQYVGSYTLNVLWAGEQVAGCPLTVNVIAGCDPTKVLCTGDGLKGGILGEEIKVSIDTRRAGPGELTAICTGPQKVAFCELLDRGDGTFILYVKPQEPGRQFLTIKYGGKHVPKSPFLIKISGKPDPTKVRVYGPGVEHGVLSLYQSRFVCDTRGAGAGQLTVRIRGPKGAFRMETQRESQRDRTILCKYDPTEPGDYRIEIKWSKHHVPGSPFSVMIFDTQEELNRFLISGHSSSRADKMATGATLNRQVSYSPALADYGQYSKMVSSAQPPYRL